VAEIAAKSDMGIIGQETDHDHPHILFNSKPAITLSESVNSPESVSSRMIRKEFPEAGKYLWGDNFWSPSYFLASVGQVRLEDVKKYVGRQGRK
jgi:putative transposase